MVSVIVKIHKLYFKLCYSNSFSVKSSLNRRYILFGNFLFFLDWKDFVLGCLILMVQAILITNQKSFDIKLIYMKMYAQLKLIISQKSQIICALIIGHSVMITDQLQLMPGLCCHALPVANQPRYFKGQFRANSGADRPSAAQAVQIPQNRNFFAQTGSDGYSNMHRGVFKTSSNSML